ncbi:MAG: T9SS type A sorting domain-containing protein [Candidatus Delongbacteria bacterium]
MIRCLTFLLLLATTTWAQLGQVFYAGELDFHYSQLFGEFNGDFSVEGAIDTAQWIPALDQGLGGAIFATDSTAAQQLLTLAVQQDVAEDTTWNVFGLLYRSPGTVGEGNVSNPTSTVNLFFLWHLDSLSLPDFSDSLDFEEVLGALSAEYKLVGTATALNIATLDATSLEYSFSGILIDIENGGMPILVTGGTAQLQSFDVDVADPPFTRPATFLRVSPNPFNPSTRLTFQLAAPGTVTLRVHDLTGRLVDQRPLGWLTSGTHEVSWHASTTGGTASGVYLLRLWQNGVLQAQERALLLK